MIPSVHTPEAEEVCTGAWNLEERDGHLLCRRGATIAGHMLLKGQRSMNPLCTGERGG
jgi:hypothetical protein